jgi:hypothetical protein
MRRITMVAAMLAMVLATAAVALAVDKTCTRSECYGTNQADKLYERSGIGAADTIYGKAGGDLIRADTYFGGTEADPDTLYGGRGADRLYADDDDGRGHDGLDRLVGGRGFDTCNGDANDTYSGCEVKNVG